MKDLRIGSISARDVEPGDILVNIPHDQGGQRMDRASVIGTVLKVFVYEAGVNSWEPTYDWIIELPDGTTITHPDKPIPGHGVYVHVPRRER